MDMVTKEVKDITTALTRHSELIYEVIQAHNNGKLSDLELNKKIKEYNENFMKGYVEMFLVNMNDLKIFGYQDYCELGIDFGTWCKEHALFGNPDSFKNFYDLLNTFLLNLYEEKLGEMTDSLQGSLPEVEE